MTTVRCPYCACTTSCPAPFEGSLVCDDCLDLLTDPGLITISPPRVIPFTDLPTSQPEGEDRLATSGHDHAPPAYREAFNSLLDLDNQEPRPH